MPKALADWWNDPTHKALIARFLIFIFGALVKAGKIPTGYEGLGDFIGPFIMGSALLVPAGQMNASGVVTHTTTTTTKVEALEPPKVAPIIVPVNAPTLQPTVVRGPVMPPPPPPPHP